MTNPADLDVADASRLLARGSLSSQELTEACLARIDERDGPHSFDGSAEAINAFIRAYPEQARAAASTADERYAAWRRGSTAAPSALCGIPVGLKDLYAVAGRPLTASSRVADLAPDADSHVWAMLAGAGMVLLGHLHTHEWAAGGSCDQVGNPWALERSPGGSSGGSAAALAAKLLPAATGSDTAGSLRIPSALCGTSSIKPTRGAIAVDGVIPLAWSLDHAGPMARTVEDCELLLTAMRGGPLDAGAVPVAPTDGSRSLAGCRLAVSPRLAHIPVENEIAQGLADAVSAARALGAEIIEAPLPEGEAEMAPLFFDILGTDMLAYHRRFDERRGAYRPSTRELLEHAEHRGISAEEYGQAQLTRGESTGRWARWFRDRRIDGMLEPTVAFVAPHRGHGYDHFTIPDPYTLLTYQWDWTGFPVAALPTGLGKDSGLPVGVSVVGPAHSDRRITGFARALQQELGVPTLATTGRR